MSLELLVPQTLHSVLTIQLLEHGCTLLISKLSNAEALKRHTSQAFTIQKCIFPGGQFDLEDSEEEVEQCVLLVSAGIHRAENNTHSHLIVWYKQSADQRSDSTTTVHTEVQQTLSISVESLGLGVCAYRTKY